jgi:drug/metabolite transporter (DMT)-like permease
MNKGYVYAIIGAIFFGSAGMFIKLAYATGLNSIELLTIQYIIAVLVMFIMAFAYNRRMLALPLRTIFNLAVLGIIGNTFMTVFYYKAFQYLPVAMVTMLLYTYPLMVFIYGVVFRKAKIDRKKASALILALIGCFLTLNIIGGGFKYSIYGIICGLLSAAFYAFMNIYSEEHLTNVNAFAINAYSTLFSLISLLAYKFPSYLLEKKLSQLSIIYIFILAAICEIIPLTLLYAAIKRIGALKVSIISNLEIPTAMIVSYFIMKESITLSQIAGAVLIIYAVYLIKSNASEIMN